MIIPRSALSVPLFLMLVACSQPPAGQPVTKGLTPAPLLTADEMAKILLEKAAIWKFESNPGVQVKQIRLQFVEGGKTIDRMTSQTGDHPVLTKIIIVIQDTGDNRHRLRIYHENPSGSALATADAWFSKPLTSSGSTVPTEVKPIALGTTTLIEGWTEMPIPGESYSTEDAPCRLNLIIE